VGVAAILLSLLAGACFALSWALQHRAASSQPNHAVGDPRLLLRLLRRRGWLLGRLLAVAGVVAQAMALRHGALSAVAPLMLTGIVFAVPLSAWLDRRATPRGQAGAVVVGIAGLAAFLAAAAPDEGTTRPSTADWVAIFAVCGGLVLLLLIAAGRREGAVRATLIGLATGTLFGLAAALLKADAVSLDDGAVGVLTQWTVYAWIVVCVLALVLNQNAFQGTTLAAPLTSLALSEPLVALAIGVGAFGEHLHAGGPRLLLVAAGVAAMVVGIRQITGKSSIPAASAISR
jgi:drug/metabolite transporter (DMT)-like permease